MTRIVAGSHGGRRIVVPRGALTRPTSERVREALFSLLEARGVLDGARVLDLFAGSGALGLEAASRGARHVVLVDSGGPAVDAARRNVADLALPGVEVVHAPVQRFLAGRRSGPADVALLDPPYAMDDAVLAEVLAALVAGDWLSEGAVVVVERSVRSPQPGWPPRLRPEARARRHGETVLWLAVNDGVEG